MSYLPYGSGGTFSWLAATSSSMAVHGGVLAIALGAIPPLFDLTLEDTTSEPEFTITLQQLDSDTLAGLIARDGIAGVESDALTDLDAADAVQAEEGEEVAALQPEAAPVSQTDAAETIEGEEAEALEADEPDSLPEVEAVEDTLEPETVEPLPEVETVEEAPEAETLEPLPEIEAVEAEPVETLEALPEAEVLAALPEPETVTPLPEPETLGAPEGASESVEGLQPAPEVAAPVDNNPLLSERPTALVPEVVDTVAPTATAVAPAGRTSLSAAPVSSADVVAVLPRAADSTQAAESEEERTTVQPSDTVTPRVEAIETAAAAIVAPRRAPNASTRTAVPPPPTAQDLAIGELLGRIRTAPPYDCLIALPRRDGAEGVGLALIAASDREISDFVETVLTEEDANTRQTRNFVDPRQCPALGYVRQNRDYPATRLGIAIEQTEIPSGERLVGRVRGTAGKYVKLLLIDSNGVVQDLQRFVTFSGNTVGFNVPVNRNAQPRDTSQLILAIATQRPANVFRERSGQLAQDVFVGLEGELASGAAITIATFDVR